MWYQVLVLSPLFLIPVLVMTTKCHTPNQNPDVVVISSKHAEADLPTSVFIKNDTAFNEKLNLEITTENVVTTTVVNLKEEEEIASSKEDVIFIPNDKEVTKQEYYYKKDEDKMTLHDLINPGQKLSNILNPKNIHLETEKPAEEDIIFITGKNHDILDKHETTTKKTTKKVKSQRVESYKIHPEAKGIREKLNCTDLDCHNHVQSVCGGKLEIREWKYRLFLNKCYFRKVNCYFKKRENRYQEVPLENCNSIAAHSTEPIIFKPYQPKSPKPEESSVVQVDTRRVASRRSLTMGIDGRLCSHACPVSCPEHYEPECAVSGTGRIRVFMNHCKMDWNSCSYGVVWHRRPLADCVGGKKADLRQNRGFINWMQSVGIVDNKGRLVLH